MAFVVVSDLDRAISFYVDTLGAQVLQPASARRPAQCVLRPPGEQQCLTLVEVRVPGEPTCTGSGGTGGSNADWGVQADIELSRVAGAAPDDAGLWRTPRGDVVAWFRDHAGGISSLHRVA
jgi:catechol 2,3-dioxygenase-like lactoylglutathione lyase family enzyme